MEEARAVDNELKVKLVGGSCPADDRVARERPVLGEGGPGERVAPRQDGVTERRDVRDVFAVEGRHGSVRLREEVSRAPARGSELVGAGDPSPREALAPGAARPKRDEPGVNRLDEPASLVHGQRNA